MVADEAHRTHGLNSVKAINTLLATPGSEDVEVGCCTAVMVCVVGAAAYEFTALLLGAMVSKKLLALMTVLGRELRVCVPRNQHSPSPEIIEPLISLCMLAGDRGRSTGEGTACAEWWAS